MPTRHVSSAPCSGNLNDVADPTGRSPHIASHVDDPLCTRSSQRSSVKAASTAYVLPKADGVSSSDASRTSR